MNHDDLHSGFLGPSGENGEILRKYLMEFLRDHLDWRKEFHPEDPSAITESDNSCPDEADNLQHSMREQLSELSEELKDSVPFFSPRYAGHMASDLLLPGLIAEIMTTLYNPNNVSEEAAPVTIDYEIEVGYQLARMFGYETEGEHGAWGHLTSGGTLANYESLRNIMSVRHFPLALSKAVEHSHFSPGTVAPLQKPISECTSWELFNLSLEEVINLRQSMYREAHDRLDSTEFEQFVEKVRQERIEAKGTYAFYRDHEPFQNPVVLVPITGHYSWTKALKSLNLGTNQLVEIETDEHMRMDVEHLRSVLDDCLERQVPVLATVGVLGNTEFGTVDPIGEIVSIREEFEAKGLAFPVHVDAAWGGYLTSIFRGASGELIEHETLQEQFQYFPSERVYDAFSSMSEVDSITVDPHKQGYIPYPAGAYVARWSGMLDFIEQGAPYVFDDGKSTSLSSRERLRDLGKYILEGSKPGASAAAAYVTHRVIPLHNEGFGNIFKKTIRACEYFFDRVQELKEKLSDKVYIQIPFEPDTNLVCLAMNPAGNDALAEANAFARRIYDQLKVDPEKSHHKPSFFVSKTSISKQDILKGPGETILREIGLSPETLRETPQDPSRESDHLFLIRNAFMNPWLMEDLDGENYIDRYVSCLENMMNQCLQQEKIGSIK